MQYIVQCAVKLCVKYSAVCSAVQFSVEEGSVGPIIPSYLTGGEPPVLQGSGQATVTQCSDTVQ